MEIRLIALDMDGTLLDPSGSLSPRSDEVLTKALARGVQIAIATGRALSALPQEVAARPGIRYAITSNGSSIYDLSTGSRIYSNDLPPDRVLEILGIISQFPVAIEAFVEGRTYAPADYVADPANYQIPPKSFSYVKTTRTPVQDIAAFIREHRGRMEGLDIVTCDMALKERIRRQTERIQGIHITSSVPHYLEFSGQDSNKGTALAHLARLLTIPREQILAVGDGENDLEMIRFAGVGVAMGNGCKALKKAADHVTGANDEDGAARAIETFVLL